MPLFSAQTIINQALTDLGLLEQGGTPSVSDSNLGLDLLNMQLGQWRIQELLVWSVANNAAAPYALVANQKSYLIGPGAADFSVARPTWIERAVVTLAGPNPSNLIEHDVRVTSMAAEYEMQPDKKAAGAIPEFIYNDRGDPVSTLYPYPVPRVATATGLILYTWAQIADFATLATTENLPDGYSEPISYALAVRLAPAFGAAVAAEQVQLCSALALQGEQQIKVLNANARNLMMPQTAQGKGQ